MHIEKLTIQGLKKFAGYKEFNFNNSSDINSISGRNGSGKSTIADAIMIVQECYFFRLLEGRFPKNEFTKRVEKSIKEKLKDLTFSTFSIVLTLKEDETATIELTYDKKNENFQINILNGQEQINKLWNLDKVDNLIIYVSSTKYYDESNISLSDIEFQVDYPLPMDRDNWMNLNLIFFPNTMFKLLYKNMIDDWALERIIPSKGKRDLYIKLAEEMIKIPFSYLKFNNFSANNYKENEIVRLVTNGETDNKRYDMRQLSTGEKTIFYLLLYLNLVGHISVLIIDEIENHMHEDLLKSFIWMLQKLVNKDKMFTDILKELKVSNNIIEKYLKYYGEDLRNKIDQVFLITHSKSLIYYLFTCGKNYVIGEDFLELSYEECEKKLREIGVSSIYNKILFVEGRTDGEYFDKIKMYDVEIVPLENCDKVIQTYRSLESIKSSLSNLKYVFILDADETNYEKTADIREENPDNFIILDRHEIENYLLDIDVWVKAALNLVVDEKKEDITQDSIREIIIDTALDQIDNTKKLYLEQKLRYMVNELNKDLTHRNLPLDGKESFSSHVSNVFSKLNEPSVLDKVGELFIECNERYSQENVREKWEELCPGKQVLRIAAKKIGDDVGVLQDRFIQEVEKFAFEDDNSSINKLLNKIKQQFIQIN